MRIGVVPLLDGDSGGVYQYCLSVLAALRSPGTLGPDDSVVLFVHDPKAPIVARVAAPGWTVRPLSPPSPRKTILGLVRKLPFADPVLAFLKGPSKPGASRIPEDIGQPRYNRALQAWFRRQRVDVMLYPVPMSAAFESRVPYIFTVHDLQHRLQPHFPEVGEPTEWRAREYLFRNGVRNALLVIADSEIGCEDVLNCYGDLGVDPKSLRALPFLPADYIKADTDAADFADVRRRLDVPERYFFYPAQFWPHKNHARLVEALAWLKNRHGIEAPLVLCGSRNNWIREATFNEVMRKADQLGVAGQIRYLGFVADADMPALYAGAEALLMPTFFGPTNIPILEAWALGCPVMTSDIRGVRDQAGDAAALADPASHEAMGEIILRLWMEPAYRDILRGNGYRRLALWRPEHFAARLADILSQARSKLVNG